MGAPIGNCNACHSASGRQQRKITRYRSIIKGGKASLYKRYRNKSIGYRQWKTSIRTQKEWEWAKG